MNHDEKFWLTLWLGLGVLILLAVSLGTYSGYLDNQHNKAYLEKGLQPYDVTTCSGVITNTEWHESGWNRPIETNSLTILTK